ncbi:aerobic carbon-monoxide dehydrogenase large subunit [Kitasatospora purpeofusca]|uniref:aerobic carbon-monoxide dehydrogenase large subunit n=1 Tax=Kitasatospora purpeofusca TaxID=67352 RepID=UPI002253C3E3|nr:aerobic carbon-monoxide dehydrogenase large subunit [Kitasatospora purpeofusca]MCX4755151.1 aerobic carbon-monoxide dehydrogenase large subunit [Kitasatospora purpeofusca]WSR36959.1 aerobic carbon-monoxide dehydrogenase large subunit [Kitasatospora purpeofusca]WSR37686.1 aerobic carbon-monoxide dehydrogenase large subunit [Kitasatospora purpeofusca]
MIGQPTPRLEDGRFLTGRGRFADGLGSGAYFGAIVRSPHAAALVLSVDTTAARALPGVVTAVSFTDLPTSLRRRLPLLIPHQDLTRPRTGYVLANERVCYVGEPVALIVARDRYVAQDACDLVQVAYTSRPAVTGLEEADRAHNLVHPDIPGNTAAHHIQQTGDIAAALDRAPYRLQLDLAVERSTAAPLEPRATLASWDDVRQRLNLVSNCQAPHGVAAAVAAFLDLPGESVTCTTPDIGGAFGGKLVHPWPEDVLTAWAARHLGHPVAWTEDRRENLVASCHERGQLHRIAVGFDAAGRILALDVRFLHDTGAYTPYGIIVPHVTATQILGPYRVPAYRIEFRSLYTNAVIVTPYRGAGRPQGCFVMERTIDSVARHLHLDRADVRAANLVPPESLPLDRGLVFQDGAPLVQDTGDYPAALRRARTLIGWDRFPALRTRAARGGRRLGIGLACYVEGTGLGPYEGARVSVAPNGRVRVATAASCQGQGHETVLAQVVAHHLGCGLNSIDVTTGRTDLVPYGAGTYASRTAVVTASAAAAAAQQVRHQALATAADHLGVPSERVDLADGTARIRDEASGAALTLAQLAVLANPLRYAFDAASHAATQFARPRPGPALAPGTKPGLDATAYFAPSGATCSYGVHAAVVETDPETAQVRILRYIVVHDCGTLINPMLVEGQIRGGVAQGIAGALLERILYTPDGQPLTTTYAELLTPGAADLPDIQIEHMSHPTPLNPLGTKGVGEGGVIPVSAVLASAIEDADGIFVDRVPLLPEVLHRLRADHARRNPARTAEVAS